MPLVIDERYTIEPQNAAQQILFAGEKGQERIIRIDAAALDENGNCDDHRTILVGANLLALYGDLLEYNATMNNVYTFGEDEGTGKIDDVLGDEFATAHKVEITHYILE